VLPDAPSALGGDQVGPGRLSASIDVPGAGAATPARLVERACEAGGRLVGPRPGAEVAGGGGPARVAAGADQSRASWSAMGQNGCSRSSS